MKRLLSLILLATLTGPAAAATKYVSDQLVITLRSGMGNAYQVLRTLPSGSKLEVLEEGEEYTRVSTEDGIEGWVRSQYLIDQPIARDRLSSAEAQLERVREKNTTLQQQLNSLQSEKAELEKVNKALREESAKLGNELAHLNEVAGKPLELEQQNKEMKERLIKLDMEVRLLQEENASLKDRAKRDWFLAGAGVLFAGLLLGLLIPKMRRRSSWGSL